jgi:hypothetical protein
LPKTPTNFWNKENSNRPKNPSKTVSANSLKASPFARKDFTSTSWQANPN